MDPNATLAEIRELVKLIKNPPESAIKASSYIDTRTCQQLERATRLTELVEALDNWIVNGGFFPDAWTNLTIEQRKILASPNPFGEI